MTFPENCDMGLSTKDKIARNRKDSPRINVAYLFETSDSGVPRLVWSSSEQKNIEPPVSHVLLS